MLEEKKDALYEYLKNGKIEDFNKTRSQGLKMDLVDANFRACDLRCADLNGLDLSGAYFKNADLRGLDLSQCKLDGGSFLNAKVSGVYFPDCFSAEEIMLSLQHGTRIRRK